MSNIELREILQRIVSNDNSAFEDLYNDYSKVIFGIALSVLKNEENCHDVVQLVISKLYTMCKENFPTSHELTWLYTVTKNEALQLMRKEKPHVPLDDILELTSKTDEITDAVDMETYKDMIKSLDTQTKAIVTLKVIAGFSHREIGKLLHMPTGTVQWKYHMAVNKLKIALANLIVSVVSLFVGYSYFIFSKNEALTGGNIQNNEKLFICFLVFSFLTFTAFAVFLVKYISKARNKTK